MLLVPAGVDEPQAVVIRRLDNGLQKGVVLSHGNLRRSVEGTR
jgi:hypothetical protein